MKRGTFFKWALAVLLVGAIAAWWAIDRSRSFEAVVGVKLPDAATDIQTSAISSFDGGEFYASAKMTEPEFAKLMADVRLDRNPAILSNFPGAGLGGHKPGLAWWPDIDEPNEDLFFAVRPDKTHDSYIVAWYRGGRCYLRRSFW